MPPPRGLEVEQFANYPQNVLPSLLGRDEDLHLVCENQESHAVVVLYGGEGQERRYLDPDLPLHLGTAAKAARSAGVDHEHHGELAFLLEHLDIGSTHPGGHVPIDGADIVPRLVLAHLRELHPLALEYRVVVARKEIVHHGAGMNIDQVYFSENLFGNHGSCGL